MRIVKLLCLAAAALSLASCASDAARMGTSADLALVDAKQLPVPGNADLGVSDRPYRIGAFDKLMVDVFNSPQLSGKEIQVDASGRMTFPLVGTVEVAGKTPGEVAIELQDRLRGRFILNPQVTVNLKEIVSQTVTIGGEVKKPGVYPILGRMTLLTAIASAEGWTEYSSQTAVVVFRQVDGVRYAALYDARSIQKGNYADPDLYPRDVVMVGESQARRVWRDFLLATPLLAPVIYIIGRD